MNLPSPTDPKAWPPFARLLAWGALASAALLLIGAGLSQIAAVASAQGGLLSALVAGWLLATLADAPIEALARRGMARRRAVMLVWVLGAVPVLIIGGELIFALAQSLTTVVAGEPPTSAQIAGLIERPAALLQSVGLKIDLLPVATEVITLIRSTAEQVQGNLAGIAAGAVAALGPVILALGLGVILSANPGYLDILTTFAPASSGASLHRSRQVLESILARFIGRHILMGLIYGVAVGLAASLAGADAVLAGTLGGLVMAIPSIGQGPALLPPLLLVLLSAGPATLLSIALIVVVWLLCMTLLAPRLLNGVLRLSGATVFVAGAVGGLVAGIPGAIFALPLVAAIAAIRRPPAPSARISKRATTNKRR